MLRYLFIVFLLKGWFLSAQTYPVQVNVFRSGTVESYVGQWRNNPSSFRVNILMLDQKAPIREYYPRIRLSNTHGFRLETRPRIKGLHRFSLSAGSNAQLNASQLSHSIEKGRVIASGLHSNAFVKTGRLPDGFYTLCVDIHEVLSHHRVNNPNLSCTSFALIPLKAPRIIAPQKGFVFDARSRPVFTWIGPSFSRMQSLKQTYQFSLRQIDFKNRSHYYQFPMSEEVFTLETDQTTYMWGTRGNEPPLIPGKRYAWQISLKPKLGGLPQSMENKGKSDIGYGDFNLVCLSLNHLRVSNQTSEEATIHWVNSAPSAGQRLTLEYKPLSVRNDWKTQKLFYSDKQTILKYLIPDQTYQYRIKMSCGKDMPVKITPTFRFKTLSRKEQEQKDLAEQLSLDSLTEAYRVPVNIDTTQIIDSALVLKRGDMFYDGKMVFQVHQTTQNPDKSWSGIATWWFKFFRWLNYHKPVPIHTEFSHMFLNEDYYLIEGKIHVPIEYGGNRIANLDNYREEFNLVSKNFNAVSLSLHDYLGEKDFVATIEKDLSLNLDEAKIEKGPDGEILMATADGKLMNIRKGIADPMIIQDKNGQSLMLNRFGNVMRTSPPPTVLTTEKPVSDKLTNDAQVGGKTNQVEAIQNQTNPSKFKKRSSLVVPSEDYVLQEKDLFIFKAHPKANHWLDVPSRAEAQAMQGGYPILKIGDFDYIVGAKLIINYGSANFKAQDEVSIQGQEQSFWESLFNKQDTTRRFQGAALDHHAPTALPLGEQGGMMVSIPEDIEKVNRVFVIENRPYNEKGDTYHQVVSALDVVGYRSQKRTLNLVNLGASDEKRKTLKKVLKEYFNKVGIRLEFREVDFKGGEMRPVEGKPRHYFTPPSIQQSDWDLNQNGKLDLTVKGIADGRYGPEASRYIEAMLDYRESLPKGRKVGWIDKDAPFLLLGGRDYSLSLHDETQREALSDIKGYMPVGGQYGFIGDLDAMNDTEMLRVAAHELGHGMFSLKHTWEEYPDLAQQSTNNLMDYGEGLHLYKWQWDRIHNPPPFQIQVFQDSKEGQQIRNKKNLIVKTLKSIREARKKGNDTLLDLFSLGLTPEVYTIKDFKVNDTITIEEMVVWTRISEIFKEIDPNHYEISPRDYAMARNGKFSKFAFYKDGKSLYNIIVEEKYEAAMVDYLEGNKLTEEPPTPPYKDIKIYIQRTSRGKHSTTGTLTTDDGTIKGYTVEPPRGTDNQAETICTDTEKIPFDCFAILEGTYDFEVNQKTGYKLDSQKHESLRIVSKVPNGRTGILVHGGRDDAKGWSAGCILAVPKKPFKNLSYENRDNSNNSEKEALEFNRKLKQWVIEREQAIKKKYKIKKVSKQIIITKTF